MSKFAKLAKSVTRNRNLLANFSIAPSNSKIDNTKTSQIIHVSPCITVLVAFQTFANRLTTTRLLDNISRYFKTTLICVLYAKNRPRTCNYII